MTVQFSSHTINDETQRASGSVENSTVSWESTIVDAANFDAERTKFGNLTTAITALSLGRLIRTRQAGLVTATDLPRSPASDPDAQRERRWKLVGTVNSGARLFPAWTRSIAAADITDKLVTEERLDPTAATFIALKTAVEAYVLDDNDPVILDRVILVGKNL